MRTVAGAGRRVGTRRLAERSFDAVLTDVSLPGMSGIDLAKEFFQQYPKLAGGDSPRAMAPPSWNSV